MNAKSDNLTQLAFGKSDDAPLTRAEEDICEEWESGKASELMKVDIDDPRMLEYAGLYDQLQKKKDLIWQGIEAAHSISATQPAATPVIPLQRSSIGKRSWVIAAAVLSGSIIGVYALYSWLNTTKPADVATSNTPVVRPIEPGKEKATLTLANNVQIDLDALKAGVIAYQGNIEISKQADNQIVYKSSARNSQETSINSLSTPYGDQYQVTLSDGSIVWLNAGSSLKYPSAFTGTDRKVEISGEGYFEVAEDKTKPFHVFARGTEVKVLGTKFDVKAYEFDEQVTTTLVSGAIAIQSGNTAENVKPNQQAVVTGSDIKIKNKSKEQVNQVLAWKNGLINLEGESVQSILQQIKRWYNVETSIEGTPEITMTGSIKKSTSLVAVLELLNTNLTVTFTLQGRTVIAKEKAH